MGLSSCTGFSGRDAIRQISVLGAGTVAFCHASAAKNLRRDEGTGLVDVDRGEPVSKFGQATGGDEMGSGDGDPRRFGGMHGSRIQRTRRGPAARVRARASNPAGGGRGSSAGNPSRCGPSVLRACRRAARVWTGGRTGGRGTPGVPTWRRAPGVRCCGRAACVRSCRCTARVRSRRRAPRGRRTGGYRERRSPAAPCGSSGGAPLREHSLDAGTLDLHDGLGVDPRCVAHAARGTSFVGTRTLGSRRRDLALGPRLLGLSGRFTTKR